MKTEEARDLLKECENQLNKIPVDKAYFDTVTKARTIGLITAFMLLKWYLGEETIEHVKEFLCEIYDNTSN